jgi:ribosomal protein L37AE/L43A
MENSNENIKFGICPECKVREKDSSEKKLYQCPHCKEWFCEKHVEPKLVITWSAIERTRDRILKEKLYEEWRKEGGHPCSVWTMQYFENLEMKEKEEREKFLKALDKLEKMEETTLYTKSSKKFSKEKISPKDVAIILMLILLIYFIAVRNITISIFILLVLALITVIFR